MHAKMSMRKNIRAIWKFPNADGFHSIFTDKQRKLRTNSNDTRQSGAVVPNSYML